MKWLAAVVLLLAGCRDDSEQVLKVEAYVWQTADRADVRDAVRKSGGLVSRLHFRAAEMRWDDGTFVTQWFVKDLPVPDCGLVVRIGASASGLDWTPEQIAQVSAVFEKAAEFSPSEIQCDFDCPQKKLGSYKSLLDALQNVVGEIPLVPTALPSWMAERDFGSLVEGRPGYVLQVHSLQLPERAEEPTVISDPEKARSAARKAAALGVPFRIAMATYGCEVRFGADGKVLDVVSEDLVEMPPGAVSRSFALADPVESAKLIVEWKKERPEGLQSIVWYRLPIAGDRRNWPMETLRLVALGKLSDPVAVLEATSGPGARDLSLANHGKFPVRLPREIRILTPTSAADGGGAYRATSGGEGVKFLLRDDIWPWLDPGKSIASGWLRTPDGSGPIDWESSK